MLYQHFSRGLDFGNYGSPHFPLQCLQHLSTNKFADWHCAGVWQSVNLRGSTVILTSFHVLKKKSVHFYFKTEDFTECEYLKFTGKRYDNAVSLWNFFNKGTSKPPIDSKVSGFWKRLNFYCGCGAQFSCRCGLLQHLGLTFIISEEKC